MAYRILSLDGGGSRTLLQVMALQRLYGENASGHEVLKDFNLVAANSGGSITLGGFATNRFLDDLLWNFFLNEKQRALVFRVCHFLYGREPSGRYAGFFRIGKKYSTRRKFKALSDVLGVAGSPTYQGRSLAETASSSL